MALGKQAKTLSKRQVDQLLWYVSTTRNPVRNRVIVLLSVKAGLRAKEIAHLEWSMVTNSAGELADSISLTDAASKGRSGRVIPVNSLLLEALHKLLELRRNTAGSDVLQDRLILSQRSKEVSPQVIVNMFCDWYRELGFKGCSSHSGRRTFITNMAQKITVFQGSLRDVQTLAGHSSLGQTQRYIEPNERAKRAAVELI